MFYESIWTHALCMNAPILHKKCWNKPGFDQNPRRFQDQGSLYSHFPLGVWEALSFVPTYCFCCRFGLPLRRCSLSIGDTLQAHPTSLFRCKKKKIRGVFLHCKALPKGQCLVPQVESCSERPCSWYTGQLFGYSYSARWCVMLGKHIRSSGLHLCASGRHPYPWCLEVLRVLLFRAYII